MYKSQDAHLHNRPAVTVSSGLTSQYLLVCRAGLMPRDDERQFGAQWADPAWVKRWLCLGINSWEPVCGLAGQVGCISPSHPHQSCNIQSYKKWDSASEACNMEPGRRSGLICHWCRWRTLASEYCVHKLMTVWKELRPTIAWSGWAWLMLDLLNKRAAQAARRGPAACLVQLACWVATNTIIDYYEKIIYFKQITICIQRHFCYLVYGQLHSWSCLICAELTALELLPVQVQSESGPSEGGWGERGERGRGQL